MKINIVSVIMEAENSGAGQDPPPSMKRPIVIEPPIPPGCFCAAKTPAPQPMERNAYTDTMMSADFVSTASSFTATAFAPCSSPG